ncbi:MAG: NTP transferase domain-containing protein [Bacteroidota bacterium]
MERVGSPVRLRRWHSRQTASASGAGSVCYGERFRFCSSRYADPFGLISGYAEQVNVPKMTASPTGIVLAAGRGYRLAPVTDKCPKPLLEVGGYPLIEYQIRHLAMMGVRDLVVVVGHLGAQIEDYVRARFEAVFRHIDVATQEVLGMSEYALAIGTERAKSDTIICLCGDDLLPVGALSSLVECFTQDVAAVFVALPVESAKVSRVQLSASGQVTGPGSILDPIITYNFTCRRDFIMKWCATTQGEQPLVDFVLSNHAQYGMQCFAIDIDIITINNMADLQQARHLADSFK